MKKKQNNKVYIDPYPFFMKKTHDYWSGNFEGDQVKVMYIGKLSDGTFRVLVDGTDDTGMERDFLVEQDALDMFELFRDGCEYIDFKDVEQLGFRHK